MFSRHGMCRGRSAMRVAVLSLVCASGCAAPPERGDEEAIAWAEAAVSGTPCDADVDCDDGDPCSVDQCDGGQCKHHRAPNGTACDDGNACTLVDGCQSGVCTGDSAVECEPLDECQSAGVCDPATGRCGEGIPVDDGTPCDDESACTQADACQSGVCVGADPVVCNAVDRCHLPGKCDAATGLCDSPVGNDGERCDDGDACSLGDVCQSGACAGVTFVKCPEPDACHLPGTCDSLTGLCSNPPTGTCAADDASVTP